VLSLAAGTFAANALVVLATVPLARLFAPGAFGEAAFVVALAMPLAAIAALQYQLALVHPEDDVEAANVFAVAIACVLAVALLCTLAVALVIAFLPRVLESSSPALLWFVPAIVLVSGLRLPLDLWSTRTRRFGRAGMAHVSEAVGSTGPRLAFGLSGWTSGAALLVGTLAGGLISTLVLAAQTLRGDGRMSQRAIRPARMLAALRRYRRFPAVATWGALGHALSEQLPIWLFAAFFSAEIVGYYALGMRTVSVPVAILRGAIAQVMFERSARAARDGQLGPLMARTVEWVLVPGLFFLLALVLGGREAVVFALGHQWSEAGAFVQLAAPFTFMAFISGPTHILFTVHERQGLYLALQVSLVAAWTLSGIAGGLARDPRLAVGLMSASGTVLYGAWGLLALRLSGVPARVPMRAFGRAALVTAPVGLLVMLVHTLGWAGLPFVTFVGVASAAVALAMIFTSPTLRAEFAGALPMAVRWR
jgi:O-antigen/teichoic acid export membrane protein